MAEIPKWTLGKTYKTSGSISKIFLFNGQLWIASNINVIGYYWWQSEVVENHVLVKTNEAIEGETLFIDGPINITKFEHQMPSSGTFAYTSNPTGIEKWFFEAPYLVGYKAGSVFVKNMLTFEENIFSIPPIYTGLPKHSNIVIADGKLWYATSAPNTQLADDKDYLVDVNLSTGVTQFRPISSAQKQSTEKFISADLHGNIWISNIQGNYAVKYSISLGTFSNMTTSAGTYYSFNGLDQTFNMVGSSNFVTEINPIAMTYTNKMTFKNTVTKLIETADAYWILAGGVLSKQIKTSGDVFDIGTSTNLFSATFTDFAVSSPFVVQVWNGTTFINKTIPEYLIQLAGATVYVFINDIAPGYYYLKQEADKIDITLPITCAISTGVDDYTGD